MCTHLFTAVVLSYIFLYYELLKYYVQKSSSAYTTTRSDNIFTYYNRIEIVVYIKNDFFYSRSLLSSLDEGGLLFARDTSTTTCFSPVLCFEELLINVSLFYRLYNILYNIFQTQPLDVFFLLLLLYIIKRIIKG